MIISNMAWLPKKELGEVNTFLLKKRLTLLPSVVDFGPKSDDEERPPKILQMWRETDTHLGVPRAYYFANKRGANEEVFETSLGRPLTPNTNEIRLRPDDQQPVAEKVLAHFRDKQFAGGIIQAYTAFGKTTTAIKLAEIIGVSTLVLVHKNPLKEQWIERIRQFYPSAKIGVVQGSRCNFEGKDFVIAMAQSIMKLAGDKYPPALWSAFGLVIIDETHRFGAEAFSTVAPRFSARYMLGLSATPYRADKCEAAFKWAIGDVLAVPKATNQQKPMIYVRQTGFQARSWLQVDKETGEERLVHMNDFQKPTLLGFISKSKFRNRLIAQDVFNAIRSGRNPLVMSERLQILEKVALALQEIAREQGYSKPLKVGFYIGNKKQAELDRAAQATVVFSTLQLAKEGIDISKLDTLFLTTPVSDPVQLVGRIGRAKTVVGADGKAQIQAGPKPPMVVDYVDSDIDKFQSLFISRLKIYRRLGFQIIGLSL